MIDRTGVRIVPAFILKKKGFSGLFNKTQIFIGFEINQQQIEQLLLT